jgi:hypothetical protein
MLCGQERQRAGQEPGVSSPGPAVPCGRGLFHGRRPGTGDNHNRVASVASDLMRAARHVGTLGMLEPGAAIISIQSSRV